MAVASMTIVQNPSLPLPQGGRANYSALDEIVELVGGQWFDVIGLSASRLSDPAGIGSQIRATRQSSHNSDVRVIVGGQVFAHDPDLASAVGADATDARQAKLQVAKMIRFG